MSLSQIINVTISRNTTAVQIASFGTPLFINEGDSDSPIIPIIEGVRIYNSAAEVAADFPQVGGKDSAPVLAAQAFYAQNPSITEFYVGEHLVAGASSETISECLARIVDTNNGWYTASYSSRDADAQVAFAQAVVGLGLPKLAFVGSAHAENYAPYTEGTSSGMMYWDD